MDTKSKNRHKLGIVLILGVILLATVIVLGNYNTFYKNAKKSILTNNQFYFDARHVYANAKRKLPCLKRLPELTNEMVCVLKNMETMTITYKLSVTNLEFTGSVTRKPKRYTGKKIKKRIKSWF